MSTPADTREAAASLRAGCEGVVALPARLEPWQLQVCSRPELMSDWLERYGSPVNLLDLGPMARNAAELQRVAASSELDFKIYFARKANKALAFVDEARRLGLGIDLASERELMQVLERGVPGSALVMTAAVKPTSLLELCVASGTTVVIDNMDELRCVTALADEAKRRVSVALRLSPTLSDDRLQSRFGFGLDEALAHVDSQWWSDSASSWAVDGVHFHLDGYAAAERVSAVAEALALIDALRRRGHSPSFIDIGGGIPISYLSSAKRWERFWIEHRKGLLGERTPLTFEGHGLGLSAYDGVIVGDPTVYPSYNRLGRGAWLSDVLSGAVESEGGKQTVAEALRDRGLQLRCEPGRALVDGCGLTVARVVYRKQRLDGTWLIGVEMNRTQCRSTSDDFMVDPLLIRADGRGRGMRDPPTGPIEGYLVGAYCIERELLTWRRLRFPHGVQVGDIVVFPNTAGYLMHILESSSHQIPLALNLIVGPELPAFLDPIDQFSTTIHSLSDRASSHRAR